MYNDDPFSASTLTEGLNLIQQTYGLIAELGIFAFKGVPTTSVSIESRKGQLVLLSTKERGKPGAQKDGVKRNVKDFSIPHIPYDSVLLPSDYQNVRAFGKTDTLDSLPTALAERLADMKADHDITHEYMRMQCLKGKFIDGNGNVIYDWFNEFNIKQVVVKFDLSDPDFDVKAACRKVSRSIRNGLFGDVMSSVRVLVSPDFMDALTNHKQVKDAYQRWNDGEALRNDNGGGFYFAGLTFQEYDASASVLTENKEEVVKQFIEPATGYAFPLGTRQTFRHFGAPATFNNAVNTIGLPYYASAQPGDHDIGVDIHTQSNPLFICQRPSTLVKITAVMPKAS